MSTQPNPLVNKDPIQFAMTHKDRVKSFSPEIQLRLADALFRRFMVPKFLKTDPKINADDLAQLRIKFAQNLLDIPGTTGPYERHTDETPKRGVLDIAKTGLSGLKSMATSPVATAEGAAAGALGDLKNISQAVAFFDRTDLNKDKLQQAIVNAGNKLYSSAQKRDPLAADIGASLGKQLPAMGVASGVSGAMGPAKGIISGAAKGGAEMAAYAGTTGDKLDASGMGLGMALGAFFPLLSRVFGSKGGAIEEKAGTSVGPKDSTIAPTEGVATTPTTPSGKPKLQNLADIVSQEKFKKNFKDLSPAERTQMPQAMNEKLKSLAEQQRAAKMAARKANKAAAKEVSDLASKMKAAKQEAANQVTARKAKAASQVEQAAVATKAAEENPQMSQAAATVQKIATPAEPIKPVTVSEGEHGTGKIAQQAKDRERMASVREESVRTKQMEALEQQARELAGRVSPGNLQNVPIPELEEAAQELDPKGLVVKGMMKMRKAGKYSLDNDDFYRSQLMEFIMKNLTGEK
jgi:hypothetical protein